LRDISWEPHDLNILIGANCAGKSNLLRLLELISASAQGKLSRLIQDAGGIEPVLWDGQADHLAVSVKTTPVEENRNMLKDSLTYELTLGRISKTAAYRIQHELLGKYYRVDNGEASDPFKFLERNGLVANVFDESERRLTAPEESVPEEESLLSLAAGPFSANHHIPPIRTQLASWCIYHDLHVNKDAAIRQPAIARPEKRVDPDGQNLIPVLHTLYTGDRQFKRDIDAAMRAAFGDEFEELVFPPASDQRIQLRIRWKSLRTEQSARDLSDGTLRFLFLLTALTSPSPAPLVAIDEPETGLHPGMLPILAEHAIDASKRTQIILTTHSPQLLDAFTDAQPNTTVVRWKNGQTQLINLEPDRLAKWLKEYSLGSLFKSGELEDLQ
jgi:predicted ATPase